MKLKSLGLIVASVLLTSVFNGCVTIDQKSALPGSGSVTINDHGERGPCKWNFIRSGKAHGNKLLKGSLDITAGGPQCTVAETNIFIGDGPNDGKEVLDIGAVEFTIKGSCRYCYTNSAGGMTCVTYPC